MAEIELKPCPFCGANSLEIGAVPDLCGMFQSFVTCYDCGATIEGEDFREGEDAALAEAAGLWNKRLAPVEDRKFQLNELAQELYSNAKEHGWWDEPRSFGDIIALCHSELSEALEEYRNGKPMIYYGTDKKPEGVAVEMIDCIIRILDWCGHENIDADKILKIKHEYNKTRPYRHGGKKV